MTRQLIGPPEFVYWDDEDRLVFRGGVPHWVELPLLHYQQWEDHEWLRYNLTAGTLMIRAVNGLGVYVLRGETEDGRALRYDFYEAKGYEPYNPTVHLKPWRTGIEQLEDMQQQLECVVAELKRRGLK